MNDSNDNNNKNMSEIMKILSVKIFIVLDKPVRNGFPNVKADFHSHC